MSLSRLGPICLRSNHHLLLGSHIRVTSDRKPLIQTIQHLDHAAGLFPRNFFPAIIGHSEFRLLYWRSRISSITALLLLSTLMTLWTGLKPVSVISTT